MVDDETPVKKFFRLDGTLPAWPMFLAVVAGGLVIWNWGVDIDKRLSRREETSIQYRAIVDKLVADQSRLFKLEFQMGRIESAVDRMENKIDRLGQAQNNNGQRN
jgi:predicted negative regulator of RcsB-dependent stress response